MVVVLNVELNSHPNIVDETTANKYYSKYILILKLIYPDLGYKPRPSTWEIRWWSRAFEKKKKNLGYKPRPKFLAFEEIFAEFSRDVSTTLRKHAEISASKA